MGKSILVIDTPERCSMCKSLQTTDEKYSYCGILGFDYQVNEYMQSAPKGKPDWCPLREVLKKKEKVKIIMNCDYEINLYVSGYNAAIDEILKDKQEA